MSSVGSHTCTLLAFEFGLVAHGMWEARVVCSFLFLGLPLSLAASRTFLFSTAALELHEHFPDEVSLPPFAHLG